MRLEPAPPLPPRARLRWTVVRSLVARLRPATILELGCGLGAVGVRLARTATYVAAEPDARSYSVAKPRIAAAGGEVIHGDHTAVPDGRRFDLVAAFEVLEHIEHDAEVLAQWLPLVKPDGHVLLSVPADPRLFGPHDALVGHYRRYTAEDLRRLLTDAGAVDVQVRHYGWPLAYLLEHVRNGAARRREGTAADTAAERTAGSGRFLQPRSAVLGHAIRVAVMPFGVLQRLRPGTGPGLIALARIPGPATGG
ncbi:class I SAM-dependent methyltransferase [Dactylosporangium sp. NPDC000244]|uniref:class I SAM-dependent methyltransferase n=1 Tax=Dactylosporangium sp. NPDC000244 TaxID=3154365 RepID=UPI003323F538